MFQKPAINKKSLSFQMYGLVILLIACFQGIEAQSLVVADSLTKKPLPFAIVRSQKFSALSNENGNVVLPELLIDSLITVVTSNYIPKSFKVDRGIDTIFLRTKAITLRPVLLLDSTISIKKTKRLRDSRILRDTPLWAGEYSKTIFSPKGKLKARALVGVEIKLVKEIGHTRDKKRIYNGSKLACRLKVVQRDSLNDPCLIYESPIQIVDTGKKARVYFDLAEKPYLLDQTFEIHFENLGKVSGNYEFMNSDSFNYIRLDITDKVSADYESTSFYGREIGTDSTGLEMNYKHDKIPGLRNSDRPYTINYRFYYK